MSPFNDSTSGKTTSPATRAGGILTIDLDAVIWNYRRLCLELGNVSCATVVKADGYGLGAREIAPALARGGAETFFVATIDEGIDLRGILTDAGFADATIYVLNGPLPGSERDLLATRVTPVLNSVGDLELWTRFGRSQGLSLPAAVHLDTGMSRLGLCDKEIQRLIESPEMLAGIQLEYYLSHLACADDIGHPENTAQLARLREALSRLPRAPVSLANSSGIFLGRHYHFNLGRPGVALYGVNPTPYQTNPMRRVVTLQGRVLQIRQIDAHRGVGYGASFRATGPSRIATVAVGYADGLLRALSNRGRVCIDGHLLPLVGRVSMDTFTVDVTSLPRDTLRPGSLVDIIGEGHDQDALAVEAGTIGYEILTSLGARYHRVYLGGER